MNIFVSQIYVEAGISYPFSHYFQRWLSAELTKNVIPSDVLLHTYGDDFDLIFRVSAKASISEPEVKGPTVFKKDKDVEFTIFLPFEKEHLDQQNRYSQVAKQLVDTIVQVLNSLNVDVSRLVENSDAIVERIVGDPAMISIE